MVDGVVFAVYRQDACAGVCGGLHKQIAGNHQCFFVGQINGFAGSGGGHGGRQAGGTDDGGHHAVGFRRSGDVDEGLRAVQHFGGAIGGGEVRTQFGGLGCIGGNGVLRAEGEALFGQFGGLAVAAEGEDAEAFGMAGDNVERAAADAAGAAEDGEGLDGHVWCVGLGFWADIFR